MRGDRDFVLCLTERTLRASAAGLGGLDLSGTKLAVLSMEGADPSQANLEKATLAAANMLGLDLTGAQLNKALVAAAHLGGPSTCTSLDGLRRTCPCRLTSMEFTELVGVGFCP